MFSECRTEKTIGAVPTVMKGEIEIDMGIETIVKVENKKVTEREALEDISMIGIDTRRSTKEIGMLVEAITKIQSMSGMRGTTSTAIRTLRKTETIEGSAGRTMERICGPTRTEHIIKRKNIENAVIATGKNEIMMKIWMEHAIPKYLLLSLPPLFNLQGFHLQLKGLRLHLVSHLQ